MPPLVGAGPKSRGSGRGGTRSSRAPPAGSATRGEEGAQQRAALLREQPPGDVRTVVQARLGEHVEHAPALGSLAPKTTRGTRASTIAPVHIAHGSSVT